ncbi:sugar ABC transporter permease [soil metagenome]
MNRIREARAGYLFALPWFIGMAAFVLYPLVASIYFSFCDYSILKPPVWVGLANYRELFSDELFWKTVSNTGIYAAMALPASMILALVLAMLLNSKVRGMAIYRTIFFLPSLVPMISLAVLWLWMLNSEYGILNQGLAAIGIHGPNWLGDATWSKPALVVTGIWGVGNSMLIYLASLQDVPTSLLEAAELDGAGAWQKTRAVTLPTISPVILFNLIMSIIGTLQVFAVPYVMLPDGGPERSGYFYTAYLFDNAFRYNKMGYASAMGWIMFVVILVLTLVSLKLSEKHVHYQGG